MAHHDVLHMAAFTDHPAGGNPAGVVLDATGMSDGDMLATAAELGYSETAFLIPGTDSDRLRYFSPRAEVAFCGHATIATAVALAQREGHGTRHFTTLAGTITVDTTTHHGSTTATLTSRPGHSAPASPDLVSAALTALGWSHDDLAPALPPHVANAGNDHLILNVTTRERLANLDYDVHGLEAIMASHALTTVHLSWRETPDTFHARDPFPTGGVYEDPATGAAACAFGAYLNALEGHVDRTFTIHQGEDMGRPSVLHVATDKAIAAVRVTGSAVPIPCGPSQGGGPHA